MSITVDLTESELRKLSELTGVDIDVDEDELYDGDVSVAISILLENL